MRSLDLPGLAEPAELTQIIAAGCFLVGMPLIGWLVQRLAGAALRRRDGFARWRGSRVALAALRLALLVGMGLAGAFIALSILPLRAGLRQGLEKTLVAVLILSLTVIAARVAADVVRLFDRRSEQVTRSSSIFVNLSRIVVGVLGLLFLLQNLGVSITPILTALGVGGLAVALALQDTLSNFFAGLQIVATKKVKPGDFVRLESGEEGHVVDVDWRHTSVRQLPNNMVLVPNSKLADSVITNFHYPETEMAVLIDVRVAYGCDLDEVERVTNEVATETLREVPGGVSDFMPFIRYHTFNDCGIDFTVILRVREFAEQHLVKHEFVKRLHRRYRDEGIVIPYPVWTIDWPEAPSIFGGQHARASNDLEYSGTPRR